MLNILLDQADVAKALVTANKDEVLEGYVTEMLRIDPAIHGIYREAKANEVVDSASVKAGDLLYLDIAAANKNVSLSFFFFSIWRTTLMELQERAFAKPTQIDHSRPKEHYIHGDILTRTLGTELVSKIVVKTLQAVLELKNVARGPDQSGKLKR